MNIRHIHVIYLNNLMRMNTIIYPINVSILIIFVTWFLYEIFIVFRTDFCLMWYKNRFEITTSSIYHSNNDDDEPDRIEAKINSLGLKILQPLKVPPNVKTPSAWVRLRGDKSIYFRPWTTKPRWLSCSTFWQDRNKWCVNWARVWICKISWFIYIR